MKSALEQMPSDTEEIQKRLEAEKVMYAALPLRATQWDCRLSYVTIQRDKVSLPEVDAFMPHIILGRKGLSINQPIKKSINHSILSL